MKKTTLIFLLFAFISSAKAQTVSNHEMDKLKLGLGYSYDFNSKIDHHSIHVFALKRENLFFAGVEFSQVLKPFGDPKDKYEINSPGLGLGYQRIIKSGWEKFSLYGQLKFSIYPLTSTEYSLGSLPREWNSWIVENTISGGVRVEPLDHLSFFAAAGIGSTQGFFLMLQGFIPTFQVGVQVYL